MKDKSHYIWLVVALYAVAALAFDVFHGVGGAALRDLKSVWNAPYGTRVDAFAARLFDLIRP